MIKSIMATDVRSSMQDPTPYFVRQQLEVVWRDLRLSADLVVDLFLKDPQGRPVLAFVAAEGASSESTLLGRAMLARAEFHSSRALLAQFLQDRGIAFDQPPLTLLLSVRFSDRFLASLDGLRDLEVVELGAKETASETPDLGAPTREATDPARAEPGSPTPPRAVRGPSVAELVDEAKRMILRINQSIVEEVDGDLVRFNVGERVLAVLSIGDDQLSLYVGDEPDRPRQVCTTQDLDEAVNAIIERSFSLTGIAARLGN